MKKLITLATSFLMAVAATASFIVPASADYDGTGGFTFSLEERLPADPGAKEYGFNTISIPETPTEAKTYSVAVYPYNPPTEEAIRGFEIYVGAENSSITVEPDDSFKTFTGDGGYTIKDAIKKLDALESKPAAGGTFVSSKPADTLTLPAGTNLAGWVIASSDNISLSQPGGFGVKNDVYPYNRDSFVALYNVTVPAGLEDGSYPVRFELAQCLVSNDSSQPLATPISYQDLVIQVGDGGGSGGGGDDPKPSGGASGIEFAVESQTLEFPVGEAYGSVVFDEATNQNILQPATTADGKAIKYAIVEVPFKLNLDEATKTIWGFQVGFDIENVVGALDVSADPASEYPTTDARGRYKSQPITAKIVTGKGLDPSYPDNAYQAPGVLWDSYSNVGPDNKVIYDKEPVFANGEVFATAQLLVTFVEGTESISFDINLRGENTADAVAKGCAVNLAGYEVFDYTDGLTVVDGNVVLGAAAPITTPADTTTAATTTGGGATTTTGGGATTTATTTAGNNGGGNNGGNGGGSSEPSPTGDAGVAGVVATVSVLGLAAALVFLGKRKQG